MREQAYESVRLVLDKLGVGINEAVDAFSRWAVAEVVICLMLGLLVSISLFTLVKILPKYLGDKDEIVRAVFYTAGVTVFFVLGILFLDQLCVAVKAVVSPKAYAIKNFLSLYHNE